MPRGVPNSREIHTADMPIRKFEALDLTETTIVGNLMDNIEPIDPDLMPKTQADRVAFFEEPLEIRIEPGRERNPQKIVPLGVNGETKWVPIGIPVRLRRKFVEVLARSQPYTVRTDVGSAMEQNPHNRLERETYRAHPFSVLHDPNPNGAAWLSKVMAEG